LEDIPIDEIPPEIVEALKTETETNNNETSEESNSSEEDNIKRIKSGEKMISKSSKETRFNKKKQIEEEKSN